MNLRDCGGANITLLELADVWKSYDGENDVLKGVNLIVNPAETIIIFGSNGSGKTTLLNIAGCLDFPSRGSVSIEGRRVDRLKERELSEIRLRTIGFVFQEHNLIEELTIAQNVMLPLRLAGEKRQNERTKKILNEFDLFNLASRRPMELSTGQRQLAAVARAIANEPSILLADEPTAALDDENRSLVIDALRVANESDTALMITCHDQDNAFTLEGSKWFTMRDGELQPHESTKHNLTP